MKLSDKAVAGNTLAVLSHIAACFIVAWPPYRETTLSGSVWILNHGPAGWAETTHEPPLWRYTYVMELATYAAVALQFGTTLNARIALHVANFVLIVCMYLRAIQANAATYPPHNTVSAQAVVSIAILTLNTTSLIGSLLHSRIKGKTN